jgi:hypothetical protein
MRTIAAIVVGLVGSLISMSAGSQTCSVRSGATVPTVVELYTSEGCSSCPPADRWLSTLKGRSDVVSMAFHVDYWDRLGWADRFADAAYTARQQQLQASSGARFVYTPQVVVNGQDWRWRVQALPAARPSPVEVVLSRDGRRLQAELQVTGAHRLAAFWAVVEDGHVSRVTAGENAGATLQHDHVVRHYQSLGDWNAGSAPRSLSFELPAKLAGRAHRVVLVVTDARTSQPLQAVQLAC